VGLAGELDRRLSGELGPEDFVTLVLAEFGPGEVRLVNCGHHPPLRIGDHLDPLTPPSPTPPIGLDPDPVLHRARLRADERLLFYTDGLLEARDPSGEMFALDDRVRAALTELTLSEALAKLLGLVFEHTSGALSDDLVLVLGQPTADRTADPAVGPTAHGPRAHPAARVAPDDRARRPGGTARARSGGSAAALWPGRRRQPSVRHWWPW
jgi:hypothetical protein